MSVPNYPDAMSGDAAAETAITPRWLKLSMVAVVAGVWVAFAGGLSWWWGWRSLIAGAGIGVTFYVASYVTDAACGMVRKRREAHSAAACSGR